jgi:hypothetical protein
VEQRHQDVYAACQPDFDEVPRQQQCFCLQGMASALFSMAMSARSLWLVTLLYGYQLPCSDL